ncbi:MAG: hypothetical protein ACFFB3_11565, partial [Candidatus Hodarchaeota archaeon]
LMVDSSDGLLSQVALVGLASPRNVTFTNDPRGLVALDLATGIPAFYGGVQVNTHGGLLGRFSDQLTPFIVDGVFVTEAGALFEFQLLDRLSNQTLLNLVASAEPNWEFQFATSVSFIEVADIDLDGSNDVIAIASDGIIAAVSGLYSSLIWEARVNENPVAMEIGNFVGNQVPDIFLAFEGDSCLVINGVSGVVSWKGHLPYRNILSAVNIGDQGTNGYDELAVGTRIQGGVDTLGYIYILNGTTGSIITQKSCPGPAIQMTAASLTAGGQHDSLVVNFRNGLRIYNMTNITNLETYNDLSEEFFQFMASNGSLVGATTDGKLVYYQTLDQSSPTWSYSIKTDTNYATNLIHSIGILNRNGTNTVIVGILGFGILCYPLSDSIPGQPVWIFRDSAARVTAQQFPLVNCSEDSTYDILTRNAEVVYIIDGFNGSLLWRTATPAVSGEISSLLAAAFNETQGTEVVVGTQSGFVLKFSYRDANPLPVDSVFVPWYYRYQNYPITPAPSIGQQITSEEAGLVLFASTQPAIFSYQNNYLVVSDSSAISYDNCIEDDRMCSPEARTTFVVRRR